MYLDAFKNLKGFSFKMFEYPRYCTFKRQNIFKDKIVFICLHINSRNVETKNNVNYKKEIYF